MDQTQSLPLTSTIMAGDSEPLDRYDASEKKPDDVSPPDGDGDDVVYPPMLEVVPILLAMCSAMFLYALVSLTNPPLQHLFSPQNLSTFECSD
jgi:hypothetical protein